MSRRPPRRRALHRMPVRALALAALLATPALAAPPAAPLPARLAVGEALAKLPRYGVNLGGRSVWGADQLMNNVLRNPGLESGWDGTLAVADPRAALGYDPSVDAHLDALLGWVARLRDAASALDSRAAP